jgi:catechol 2,3-dioxygenase-like lactoylglutathione lyase family enzyme
MNIDQTTVAMHVGLHISDIGKTVKFYSDFFETTPNKVKPGYAKFALEEPNLVISFSEGHGGSHPKFGHMGIRLPNREAVIQKMERMKAKGLSVLEEEQTTCCYALQDKFWVVDPDGYRWEVYCFYQDIEPKQMVKSSSYACCPS